MSIFFLDFENYGLVRDARDGIARHELDLRIKNREMVIQIIINGETVDLYLTKSQASEFTDGCIEICNTLGIELTKEGFF